MAQASALGRCTHHLAGQQTMPSAGDAVVCSPQATHCAPPADIGWAGGSGVGCRYWRRHLGGSLPLFSGVNAARVARTILVTCYTGNWVLYGRPSRSPWQSNCIPGHHSQTLQNASCIVYNSG